MSEKETKLQGLREEINSLDDQLVEVLARRKRLSREIGDVKESASGQVRDLQREEEILESMVKKGKEKGVNSSLTTKVFHAIIDDSLRTQENQLLRERQSVRRIALLGGKGSYSFKAALHLLGDESDFAPVPTSGFAELIKKCEDGEADAAIIPVENSITGSIQQVYDLLRKTSLSIIGEELLTIDHSLIAKKGTKVRDLQFVYGHPQALAQCSDHLAKLSHVGIEVAAHTAEAIQKVRESDSNHLAAIAGQGEAEAWDLEVLHPEIANRKNNQTRFLLLAPAPISVPESIKAKTSVILSTPHKPGALAETLLVFRDKNINLTRVESRPLGTNNWEQVFFIDFEGNAASEVVNGALLELQRICPYLRVLGTYPDQRQPAKVSSQALVNLVSGIKVSAEVQKPTAAKGSQQLVSRGHKAEDTQIKIGDVVLGGDDFVVIAGPCSIESEEQINTTARFAKEHGAHILRGGCFKPRSSPYSFQGLGLEGLDLMATAGESVGLPIVTEVMSADHLHEVAAKAHVIQIGARNMQNFSLLKEIGRINRPVMLKRGLMASISELLQAAEYIVSQGNQQVFLCERGIRTFETATRNTLDLSAIPVIKERSHLPIIVDPSHAGGRRELVKPLALAAKAVGAHGIMVEIHPEPEKALSDGPQSLYLEQFADLMSSLSAC